MAGRSTRKAELNDFSLILTSTMRQIKATFGKEAAHNEVLKLQRIIHAPEYGKNSG